MLPIYAKWQRTRRSTSRDTMPSAPSLERRAQFSSVHLYAVVYIMVGCAANCRLHQPTHLARRKPRAAPALCRVGDIAAALAAAAHGNACGERVPGRGHWPCAWLSVAQSPPFSVAPQASLPCDTLPALPQPHIILTGYHPDRKDAELCISTPAIPTPTIQLTPKDAGVCGNRRPHARVLLR